MNIVSYNPLIKTGIAKVELCKKTDPEYIKFISKLIQKQKDQTELKQLKHYLDYKLFYDSFEKIFSKLYNKKIDIEVYPSTKKCANCYHSSLDKYRPNVNNAYVCWLKYRTDGIIKKISGSDLTCENYNPRWDTENKITIKINGEPFLSDIKTQSFCDKILKETNEEQKLIYLTWNLLNDGQPPSNVVNYNKIKSVLNNIFDYDFNWNIGKNGITFEKKIREYYKGIGKKLEPLVFKIFYDGIIEPRFKVMDVYFYDKNEHTIIEIFTGYRQIEEKITQVNDYEYLLKLSGINGKINKILLTDEKYYTGNTEIPNDISLISFNDVVPEVSLSKFFGGSH